MYIVMRLVVAVLLCVGLAVGSPAAGSPAGCRRQDGEALWFCDLGDTLVSIERVIRYEHSVEILIMCDDDAPPMPCDLIPEDAASPALKKATITLSICKVDMACLLRRLNVTGESFKTISIKADIPPPVDVLNSMGQLQSLTLEGYYADSLQKTIPVSTLYSFQNLTSFYMKKGQFSLPPEGFAQPSPLTDLELSNGGLTYLPPGVFRGLQKLTMLDLTDNKLCNLTEDVLEGLSSLEYFTVSRNGLQMLGDLTRLTPGLKTLLAYDNKLQAAPAVSGLQLLDRIYLERNQITSLAPNAFADLPALTELRLDDNQISALPATVFRNSNNIQTLFLYNNQIEELPADVFKGLSSLLNLQLNDNHIRTLPPGLFQDCSSLEGLSLTNNQLTQLSPEVFQPLRALEHLYLDHNKIEELQDDLFQNQSQMKYLSVSDNLLRRVAPRAFSGATNLQVLELFHNKLTTVYNSNTAGQSQSTPFDALNKLRQLDLRHNEIRDTFPQGTSLARVALLSDNSS